MELSTINLPRHSSSLVSDDLGISGLICIFVGLGKEGAATHTRKVPWGKRARLILLLSHRRKDRASKRQSDPRLQSAA